MTLREFILKNKIEKLEYVDSTILSVVCSGVTYGLNVDTSNIAFGTKAISTEDFLLDDNRLTMGKVVLDLESTELLGNNE